MEEYNEIFDNIFSIKDKITENEYLLLNNNVHYLLKTIEKLKKENVNVQQRNDIQIVPEQQYQQRIQYRERRVGQEQYEQRIPYWERRVGQEHTGSCGCFECMGRRRVSSWENTPSYYRRNGARRIVDRQW